MKTRHMIILASFAATVRMAHAGEGVDDKVHLTPLAAGAMDKIGRYAPQKVELSDVKPDGVNKEPTGLAAPLYGSMPIGQVMDNAPPPVCLVIVDEPETGSPRLFLDTNHNGDLTDDPAAEWEVKMVDRQDGSQSKQYRGGGVVNIGTAAKPFNARLGMYRFDKNDPSRANSKNNLYYYRDYAYEGDVTIDGKTYKAMLGDEMARGDFRGDAEEDPSGATFFVDINADGKFEPRRESFDVHKPFKIGESVHEIVDIATDGSAFRIVKSDKKVDSPPDHAVGKMITAFEDKTMDDKAVKFPGDYKGKVVMLDFWATWCGPCMREVPGLVSVYEKFQGKGFDLLGISLDRANAAGAMREVMGKQKMTWPQIYDGGYWSARLAKLYDIHSIPAAFLVDGDTGEILASGGSLRGDKLESTIESALAKKHKK